MQETAWKHHHVYQMVPEEYQNRRFNAANANVLESC